MPDYAAWGASRTVLVTAPLELWGSVLCYGRPGADSVKVTLYLPWVHAARFRSSTQVWFGFL